MHVDTERTLNVLAMELFSRRGTWLVLAIVVSVGFLTAGTRLPKKYTSYASIVVEQQNIVGSLMEGVAEQTNVRDLASIVRELAFSRRLLAQILEAGGWLKANPTLLEQELIMERIIKRTKINKRGGDLIGIEYTDEIPERAFRITRMYVDWVLKESRESKRRESMKAYAFIDSQVEEYRDKLLAAEEGLKRYRLDNMDAMPEAGREVSARSNQLQRQLETMRMELAELKAKEETLAKQLSGQARITTSLGRASEYRTRILQLQSELDTLRQSYHDTYPDIVRIKAQIQDLQASLASATEGRTQEDMGLVASAGGEAGLERRSINPLYEELRSDLATARTRRATLNARIAETQRLLDRELERSLRIADSEAQLAELTRDYEVNRDIYHDLLRRREKARLSMNLDEEHGGIRMRVQEPPVVPQAPSGIRFMHVALAGLFLSFAVPLGMSALIVQFDPRVRMKERIEQLKLPVIAVIPEVAKEHGPAVHWVKHLVFTLGVLALIGIYVTAAWLKLSDYL